MDHTERTNRIAELRELAERVEPYLTLVTEMFQSRATSFKYTSEELDTFSKEELEEVYTRVVKLETNVCNLWLWLSEHLRTLRATKLARDTSHMSAQTQDQYKITKNDATIAETMSETEVQELMKALVKKISGA